MNILWICNVPTPDGCAAFGKPNIPYGGWLVELSKHLGNMEGYNISFGFPDDVKELEIKQYNGITYYRFPMGKSVDLIENSEIYLMKKIILEVKPDILHVFGTEMRHSLAAVKAYDTPDKTIVNIQGLVSIIGERYSKGIPSRYLHIPSFIEILFGSGSISMQKKKFENRGVLEFELLQNVKYVIGRTEFDYAVTKRINSDLVYFKCNENLRKEFLQSAKWNQEKCIKYRIFVSQASYPIKGLHYLIMALPQVIKMFPETEVHIAGFNILDNSIKSNITQSSYAKYIKKLIKKLGLNNKIIFVGNLNVNEMIDEYLNANVYILSSVIENSPNSLGEAMMLGVPIVASNVGGVSSMLNDKLDGYLYSYDEDYMLSYYICKIFSSKDNLDEMSKNAIHHANSIFNFDDNVEKITSIYQEMYKDV